ncbi:MAG: hypothetical protein HRT88_13625, partial [Lentisphaeraceae bacterium]|nr:hypothetical protein [Lentisphaeraceae bacterium]
MLFKITTFVFMATTVAFATLFFTQQDSIQTSSLSKAAQTTQPSDRNKHNKSPKTDTKSLNRRIFKRTAITKSSHPQLSIEEIDAILEARDLLSQSYSKNLKNEHPLLFERLELDEEQKKTFTQLIGERRMFLYLRKNKNMNET